MASGHWGAWHLQLRDVVSALRQRGACGQMMQYVYHVITPRLAREA